MRRGFAVVAWLVATAVSVGVSTAAVGSVRNQVSERPSLVSLAAIREATSTTSVLEAAAETVGSAPALNLEISEATSTSTSTTTTTTTTTAPTVPATQPPPSTAPPPPPSSTEPPVDDPDDMPVEQLAVDGGYVKVGLANESLQLIDALPEEGFRVEMGTWLDSVIEVRFVGRAEVWKVVAELVDGHIRLSDQRTGGGSDDRPGDGDEDDRGDDRKDRDRGGDRPWERDRGDGRPGGDQDSEDQEGEDDESGEAGSAETTSTSTAA